MKKILAFILIFVFVSSSYSQDKLNPNFEFSGVDNFWEIVDTLKTDKEPTSEQWDKLFDTPGYAVLIRREFKREKLQEFISTAFKPSLSDKREELINKAENGDNRFWKWFVNSYYQAFDYSDSNRHKIIAKRQSFESFPYTDKAIAELLKFLPETEVSNPPAVSFIIFNDSRGYTPVVMGLNDLVAGDEMLTPEQVAELEKDGFSRYRPQVLYFAHEFFHHFRDQKLEFKEPENNDEDARLLWYLNQIENEGIADLINVLPLQKIAAEEQRQKIEKEQLEVPEAIIGFDKILATIYKNPEEKKNLLKQTGKYVQRSGHPMGYYMAQVILKYKGREALVKIVRNPFKFFYLYNQVCLEKNIGPAFSVDAIAMIAELEALYSLK